MYAVREEREDPPPPHPIRPELVIVIAGRSPGPHAAPPILIGGRGLVCSDFFGFGGALGAASAFSGDTDADGVSPLACSRATSRRGQAKSSARPAGGVSGSPFTSVRAASASTAAGREPGPPSN